MATVAIDAGDLDRLVNLRTRTSGKDAAGGATTTDSDSASKYSASIKPMTGREYERTGLTAAEVTHSVRMRHFTETAALTPKDAILFGTRVFDIVTIRNIEERGVYLEFVCKELVS